MGSWPLGALDLKVLDLEREIDFYERFGLARLPDEAESAVFGAGARPILRLRAASRRQPEAAAHRRPVSLRRASPNRGGARRIPAAHAGGNVFPSRETADHLVSQALYFDDPEGNGIEVYADRPRNEWRYPNGRIDIGTEHLDFETPAERG